MKRITYLIFLASMAGITSCSKQLDQEPVSDISVTSLFQNANDFLLATNGAYSKLKTVPTNWMWMEEMRSDNLNVTTDGNRDFQGIKNFSPNLTTTGFIVNAWQNNFNGISNANVALDAIATKGPDYLSPAQITRYTAECRFMRAFYYFDLVKYYGRLPIVDKPLLTDEFGKIPRFSLDSVYKFLIADFEYAEANLPVSWPSADVGRATSLAAKGMLGLVYMTRSGPVLPSGPGLNSNEWTKAQSYFDQVISSGKFTFARTYPEIFSYTNENNKEVVFDVQYATSINGADFPSQLVPDSYWGGPGLGTSYGNGYGSANYNVSANMTQSFRNSAGAGVIDIRDTFSIKKAFVTTTAANAPLDTTRPFIKKYLNVALKGKDRADWPVNFIVLRYTDVLMMKAECILHGAPGPADYADTVVSWVRTRAGVPAAPAKVDLPYLMEERRREFLGEAIRWNDLVRENMFVTTMNAWRASDALTSTIQQVIPEYSVYPIPQADILAKPGLYDQNQGYY
ncbi:carbohydrate-binding protein SusD [Niastella yeongjuensis]|uniref:Carbohydrate-binding protein SusD n=1 Tax=Niastella yeongjuensis TaxID=354355 RepID=A0A1V9F517_9BACT|nr:RagB/SusD family nutrient uptake outer membrane protein [Niastella yeongjuensis]OQP53357.1 carbohydrate-binding protein SusD [Niastella yeongjuensis]SEP14159.1 Starch-binding associating with outer membrane [Niastella yeongjuensis]